MAEMISPIGSLAADRLLLVPLNRWEDTLPNHLPLDLGFGFSVEDMKTVLAGVDLLPKNDFAKWSICLIYKYGEAIVRPNLDSDAEGRDL